MGLFWDSLDQTLFSGLESERETYQARPSELCLRGEDESGDVQTLEFQRAVECQGGKAEIRTETARPLQGGRAVREKDVPCA